MELYAFDWAVSLATLKYGHHLQIKDALMVRRETPLSKYEASAQKENKILLFKIFPLLKMSFYLKSNIRRIFSIKISLLNIKLFGQCMWKLFGKVV